MKDIPFCIQWKQNNVRIRAMVLKSVENSKYVVEFQKVEGDSYKYKEIVNYLKTVLSRNGMGDN